MKPGIRLNHRLFTTSVFDSGALGVLAYVVHQFPEGQYQATVQRDGRQVGTRSFRVAESANLQLNIDLASTVPAARATAACDCREAAARTAAEGPPVVSPKGYVLFYVSDGPAGYSVVVGDESARRAVFDSQNLSEGDLFALSFLDPTTYSLVNRNGTARGQIQVTRLPPGTDLRTLAPVYVETQPDSFQPSSISVHAAQGLVFRIHGTARIVIEKQPPPGRERARATPEGKPILRRVRVRNLA